MIAVTDASAVGWLCFALGGVVFLAGAVLGLRLGWKEPGGAAHADVKAKVAQAEKKITELTSQAVAAANKEGKDPAAAADASPAGAPGVGAGEELGGSLQALPARLPAA